MASSWLDGPLPYVPDGHWRSGTYAYNGDDSYQTWVTFLDERPVCNVWSNWGKRRDSPRVPQLKGHSLGTYFSDMWSGTAPFEFAFDVEGGNLYAGHHAVPLFNVGPLSQAATPFQGALVELDPANSALVLLTSVPGFIGPLNATGHFETPKLSFNRRMLGLRGAYVGIEFMILNSQLNAVASTGAQSILID